MEYKPFKMKGHTLPGINQRSETENLPDGRSASSPFQTDEALTQKKLRAVKNYEKYKDEPGYQEYVDKLFGGPTTVEGMKTTTKISKYDNPEGFAKAEALNKKKKEREAKAQESPAKKHKKY
tara:strand:- start:14 stop:379 length:366 start_codon:yes stop_codon:yes gene_type:complete